MTACFIVAEIIHSEVNFSFIELFVMKDDPRFQDFIKYNFWILFPATI